MHNIAWNNHVKLKINDIYLDKLQTRGVKKSIVYMWNVDYSQ
jgi:hypothetical protein